MGVQGPPLSDHAVSTVMGLSSGSVVVYAIGCVDPPDHTSPPTGLVNTTVGAVFVRTVRNVNIRGHAASWFPGSETSLAVQATVTGYSGVPRKVLVEIVTGLSRFDQNKPRPQNIGK